MGTTPPPPASLRPLAGLLAPPGRAVLAALSAALDGAGPALAPLDPLLPPAALARVIEVLAPQTVSTAEVVEHRTTGRGVRAEVAVALATSGSTGVPTGVLLTAAALEASARAALDRLDAWGQRWLCCLPVAHMGGLGVLVRSLVAGTVPVIVPRFTVEGVARALEEPAAPRLVALVPTMLTRLLDAGVHLPGRHLLVGGAALTPGLRAWAERAGAVVTATYGSTETAGGCVYDGVALDGVEISIGPDDAIRVRGPVLGLARRTPGGDAPLAGVDGWFTTGDRGQLTPDGRLDVLGRRDDVIVSGGENVDAVAVAAALEALDGIAAAVVLGVPDDEWGQAVAAAVVPTVADAPPTLADLRTRLTDELNRAALPRRLVVLQALPRLSNGKPDREALREHLAGGE